jgi:hypothetical protein
LQINLHQSNLIVANKSINKSFFADSIDVCAIIHQRLVVAQFMSCIALTGTTACPSWSSYSVYTGTGANTLFTSVAQFDAYIRNRLPTTTAGVAFVQRDLVCPAFRAAEVRYMQSAWCAVFVDVSTVRFGCNKSLPPKKLCKASASIFVSDINRLLGSTSCTRNANRAASTILIDPVGYSNRLGAVDDPNCVKSQSFDKFCGFSTIATGEPWCKARPSEACCVPKADVPEPVEPEIVPEETTTAMETSMIPMPNAVQSFLTKTGPTYVAAALGGFVFIVILIAIAVILLNRKHSAAPKAATNAAKSYEEEPGERLLCIHEYRANLFDELNLSPGDEIVVKVRFDDGWAFGFNLNNNQEGSFPLACLQGGDPGAQSNHGKSTLGKQTSMRDSWEQGYQQQKRGSSLVDTNSQYNRYDDYDDKRYTQYTDDQSRYNDQNRYTQYTEDQSRYNDKNRYTQYTEATDYSRY